VIGAARTLALRLNARLACPLVLRVEKKGGFATEGALFWKRRRFQVGGLAAGASVRPRALAEQERLQRRRPLALLAVEARQWWWFRDCFYWEDDGLTAHDVMALVVERERRRQRKLERAHAALQQELGGAPRREPIPRAVRLAVWRRDGGRCVECGSDFDLQYDHVIPFSMGGATTAENLQLLCAGCNRHKGASL
jgi:5-methylcytosine-specific restriction endonuclease McrA